MHQKVEWCHVLQIYTLNAIRTSFLDEFSMYLRVSVTTGVEKLMFLNITKGDSGDVWESFDMLLSDPGCIRVILIDFRKS